MKQAFFFTQDDSCHWYMIPVEKRERWNFLNMIAESQNEETSEGANELINDEFGEYRTGGGISDIEFIPTQK